MYFTWILAPFWAPFSCFSSIFPVSFFRRFLDRLFSDFLALGPDFFSQKVVVLNRPGGLCEFLDQNGSEKGAKSFQRGEPFRSLFATFSEDRFFDASWSPLAPFWLPFGSLWLPFGYPLVWCPLASFLLIVVQILRKFIKNLLWKQLAMKLCFNQPIRKKFEARRTSRTCAAGCRASDVDPAAQL